MIPTPPIAPSHAGLNLPLFAAMVVVCLNTATALAQPAAVSTPSDGADALRVFVDCDGDCDLDYFRTEVTFVNHVRDRSDAQVHVLITTQRTGGGGTAHTLDFVGLEQFASVDDRLVYFTSQDDTDDDERRGIARMLRVGLLRYAAHTPAGQHLDVSDNRTESQSSALNARAADDPWKFWVFRTNLHAQLNEEEQQTFRFLGGGFSANRTTDAWKVQLGLNLEYSEDTFQLSDETLTNVSRDNAFTGRVIKSVGDHVGVGFGGSAVASTFRNLHLAVRVAPAIEYNFYPYSESTRRQFTLSYSVAFNSFRYEEVTIFDKTSERRPSHDAYVSLDFNEPWGESYLTLEWSQFLDDASKYRGVLFAGVDIRLFRGFSFNVSGYSSLIRDQIFLPRRGSTDEEILLQRRQLSTDYQHELRIGFTYSFGSIFNNVVNSRFAGSSGGFIRAF